MSQDQKQNKPAAVLKEGFKDLKILWFFFRDHKGSVFIVLFWMVISSVLESINLVALYPVINYGLKMPSGKPLVFVEKLIGRFSGDNLFLGSCVLLIILTFIATASKVYYQYVVNQLIMRAVEENQNSIFSKLAGAEYKYYVKSQQGKLIYASTIAPIGISINVFNIVRILNSSLTIFLLALLMTILAWQGVVFIVVLGTGYIFFVRKILNHFVNRFSHLSVHEDEKKNVILNEFINGIKSIKAFHRENVWQEKFSMAVKRSVGYRFKVMFGHVLPDSFLKFIFFIGIGVMGIFIGLGYKGDAMLLLPALGTCAVVAIRLIPYINLLGSDIVSLARYMPDVKVVYDLLAEPMTEHWSGTKTLDSFHDKIYFKDVGFKYESASHYLFEGLSFTIEKGKMTAIVGPSGSGKSTIVNLLLTLYSPSSGAILLDDINIKELSKDTLLHIMGYVSQETFIFNGTINENISFGGVYTDQEIIEAAKLANAHDFILNTEKGYDTIVGDAGMKLSGGQRQRLAIARAMLRRPQILILDEATSSLDNTSERQVQQAINNIANQTTIVIIAHRLSTVQNADKIIVLEKGKIIEQGKHQELLKNGQVYHGLYASQSIS